MYWASNERKPTEPLSAESIYNRQVTQRCPSYKSAQISTQSFFTQEPRHQLSCFKIKSMLMRYLKYINGSAAILPQAETDRATFVKHRGKREMDKTIHSAYDRAPERLSQKFAETYTQPLDVFGNVDRLMVTKYFFSTLTD